MPTITWVNGGKITMYAADHNPPHFHLRGPDYAETYTIAERRLMKRSGKAPKTAVKAALAWAEVHESELLATWATLNEQE